MRMMTAMVVICGWFIAGGAVQLRGEEKMTSGAEKPQDTLLEIGNAELAMTLAASPGPAEQRAAELFTERIKDRSGVTPAASVDQAKYRLTISRKTIPALGADGYSIVVDTRKRELSVTGQSDSGVVAGVGRLMREIRYLPGHIEIPALQIAETPQMPNRGMYLWARKYYFYEPDRLERYIEELALWGCNGICFWFEMGMFNTFVTIGTGSEMASQHGNKLPPQEWLKMYRRFYATARRMGMKTGLIMVANDAYRTSPEALRIEPIIGCPTCYLCPSKPGSIEKLVAWQEEVFKALAPLDIYNIFPADAGGCSCKDCTPWPTKGLWPVAKALGERVHQISPKTEIWLDTWHLNHPTFGGKDWKNLVHDIGNNRPEWVAGFEVGLAPHHPFAAMSAEERELYNQVGLPLMVFPDISMWGNHKGMLVNQGYWKELQGELNDYDPALMKGGWPYAERWNTDIACYVFLSFFWNPRRPVERILDDYATLFFGPEAETGRKLIDLLDDGNSDPERTQKIRDTLTALTDSAPEWVKRDWRWSEILESCSRFE